MKKGDYTGKRKANFLVVSKNDDGTYLCKCDCGNEFIATHYQIKHGITSCGCLKKQTYNFRERECRACGMQFLGGPRAWYCPECREIRKKEAKKIAKQNKNKKTIGEAMTCEVCGSIIKRNSARQRFCTECAKTNYKNVAKKQSLEYYNKNKERLNLSRNSKRRINETISTENPLAYNILDVFLQDFKKIMDYIVKTENVEDMAKKLNVSTKTIYSWTYDNKWLPDINTLLKLYDLYGDFVLPGITHSGVIYRKEPIKPRSNSFISLISANAGYTSAQTARMLGISPQLLSSFNGNIKGKTAVVLMYAFGIDDIVFFYKYLDNHSDE